MRKLTLDFIRDEISKGGCCLLADTYIDSKYKMDCICRRGHLYLTSWNNWQQGRRCPYCYSLERRARQSKRLSFGFVKSEFDKEGYTLLSDEYINSSVKLNYICPIGHRGAISWGHWQQGHRCFECFHKSMCKYDDSFVMMESCIYKARVYQLSNRNFSLYHDYINPSNFRRGSGYHLDHIYSVSDGFKNRVSPKIIASPPNLRIVNSIDNYCKGSRSGYNLEELLLLYNRFEYQKCEGD